MRLLSLLLLLPVVLVLSACAKKIDDAKAEKFISTTVAKQVGAKVKSVKCPSDLTAKKGATFNCTVTGADGSSGITKVTERDDQGNVRVSAPFIDGRELEDSIGAGITRQVGSTVTVSCPEIIVTKKGDTFDCSATSGSDKASVAVTQTDDQGHVRYELQR